METFDGKSERERSIVKPPRRDRIGEERPHWGRDVSL